MTDKHYNNDWAKAKVHTLLGEMLDQTVLTYRKPKDIHVLHFPGVDMAETERVYLARNIPPQNIVGLERERDIADAIEQRKRGIQIPRAKNGRPLSLEEYVTQHQAFDFDVVSLDYTGPLKDTDLLLLNILIQKQQRNSFILHHANLLRRESNAAHFIAGVAIQAYDNPHLKSIEEAEQAQLEVGRRTHELIEKRKRGESLAEVKMEAYTELLRTAFTGMSVDLRRTLLGYMTNDNFRDIAEELKRSMSTVDPERKFDLDDPVGSVGCNPYALSYIDLNARRLFRYYLECERIKEESCQQVIEHAIITSADRKRRFCDELCKKYTYISETGSPMIGDIHFLRYPYQIIQKAQRVARLVGFPHEIRVTRFKELQGALREYHAVADHYKNLRYSSDPYQTERVFLGSSAKPILTKKRFIQELEAGSDISAVKTKYCQWEGKPLFQWKAHFTMGTYRVQEMVEESDEDSGLEKITEEQAYDYLSSNIPPHEIWEAYPTSFTLPQLRSFKAQMTREGREQYKQPDPPQ